MYKSENNAFMPLLFIALAVILFFVIIIVVYLCFMKPTVTNHTITFINETDSVIQYTVTQQFSFSTTTATPILISVPSLTSKSITLPRFWVGTIVFNQQFIQPIDTRSINIDFSFNNGYQENVDYYSYNFEGVDMRISPTYTGGQCFEFHPLLTDSSESMSVTKAMLLPMYHRKVTVPAYKGCKSCISGIRNVTLPPKDNNFFCIYKDNVSTGYNITCRNPL